MNYAVFYAIYGECEDSKWIAATENADPLIFGTIGMADAWASRLKEKWPQNKYTIEKVTIRRING